VKFHPAGVEFPPQRLYDTVDIPGHAGDEFA
jgi:hypothetical protein